MKFTEEKLEKALTESDYIKNAFDERELDSRATVRNFRTVQDEASKLEKS